MSAIVDHRCAGWLHRTNSPSERPILLTSASVNVPVLKPAPMVSLAQNVNNFQTACVKARVWALPLPLPPPSPPPSYPLLPPFPSSYPSASWVQSRSQKHRFIFLLEALLRLLRSSEALLASEYPRHCHLPVVSDAASGYLKSVRVWMTKVQDSRPNR